jgi:hypothetical protein
MAAAEFIEAARSSEEAGCVEAAHTFRIIVAVAAPVSPIVAADAAANHAPIRALYARRNNDKAAD